jgi:hypothetical protein
MPGIIHEPTSFFGTGPATAPPNIILYGVRQMLGAMGMATKRSRLHIKDDDLKRFPHYLALSYT